MLVGKQRNYLSFMVVRSLFIDPLLTSLPISASNVSSTLVLRAINCNLIFPFRIYRFQTMFFLFMCVVVRGLFVSVRKYYCL